MGYKAIGAILGCVATVLATPVASAKDAAKEPEFENVFMELNLSTGSLASMPREAPKLETKIKLLGYAGGTYSLIWSGPKCSYRISNGKQPEFVVRVASQRTDPHDIVQFYKLESIAGQRRMVLVKQSSAYSVPKSTLSSAEVTFNGRAHGASSLIIRPTAPLIAGEYVLSSRSSENGYCFGIDP